jgi:hypothetical protein
VALARVEPTDPRSLRTGKVGQFLVVADPDGWIYQNVLQELPWNVVLVSALPDRGLLPESVGSTNQKDPFLLCSAPELEMISGARPAIIARVSVAAEIKIIGRISDTRGGVLSWEVVCFEVVFSKPCANLTSFRVCTIVCHRSLEPSDVRIMMDEILEWRPHLYTLICKGTGGQAADEAYTFRSAFAGLGLEVKTLAERVATSVWPAPAAAGSMLNFGAAAAAAVSTELPKMRPGTFWENDELVSIRIGRSGRSDERADERSVRRWERKDASNKRKATEQ